GVGRSAVDRGEWSVQRYLDVAGRVRARRGAGLRRARAAAAAGLGALTGGREQLTAAYLEGGTRSDELPGLPPEADQPPYWAERGRAALATLARDELDRGVTLWGPHRDDVGLYIDGRDSRVHASQGQQRSLVLALKHAELAVAGAALGTPPLLLLDDVLSELDPTRS